MVKDFKKPEPRPRRPRAKPRPAPARRRPWLWFLAGVGCGAVGMWLAYNPQAVPPELRAAARRGSEAVRPSPGRPPPATRYEFYTLLPEMEVAVPDVELERPREPPAPPAAGPSEASPAPPGTTYVLQVASFRRAADAERLKAELALLGLEARIQTVSINGEQTWHRVRLGPFADLTALDEARSRLGENGLKALALRIRG